MTRVGEQAVAWGKHQRDINASNWAGLCQMFVRMCFDAPSGAPSAQAAWEWANHKHPTTNGEKVPRAVPFYWSHPPFGHVVLSVGGGNCLSTDIRQRGHVDFASINSITRAWGQQPRGWTEDINGVYIMPDNHPWQSGEVFVSRLKKGVRGSDSVRRLQSRLKNHTGAKSPKLVVTGNYGSATVAAVKHWQRKVGEAGPNDGSHVVDFQAAKIFGDDYRIRK